MEQYEISKNTLVMAGEGAGAKIVPTLHDFA